MTIEHKLNLSHDIIKNVIENGLFKRKSDGFTGKLMHASSPKKWPECTAHIVGDNETVDLINPEKELQEEWDFIPPKGDSDAS